MMTLHDIHNMVIMSLMRRNGITSIEISKAEVQATLEEVHIHDGYTNLKTEVSDEGAIRVQLTKED